MVVPGLRLDPPVKVEELKVLAEEAAPGTTCSLPPCACCLPPYTLVSYLPTHLFPTSLRTCFLPPYALVSFLPTCKLPISP
eukprot:902070-Rhodomonas_salina.2